MPLPGVVAPVTRLDDRGVVDGRAYPYTHAVLDGVDSSTRRLRYSGLLPTAPSNRSSRSMSPDCARDSSPATLLRSLPAPVSFRPGNWPQSYIRPGTVQKLEMVYFRPNVVVEATHERPVHREAVAGDPGTVAGVSSVTGGRARSARNFGHPLGSSRQAYLCRVGSTNRFITHTS